MDEERPAMALGRPITNKFPPRLQLRVYGTGMDVLEESRDRNYDLSDNLWRLWGNSRALYIGIATESLKWPVWDENALKRIEARMIRELQFDGHGVEVLRHTRKAGGPCTGKFIWKLQLRHF